MRLTQARVQHNMFKATVQKLIKIANITTQFNNVCVIILQLLEN